MNGPTGTDLVDARLREGAFLLLDKPRGPSSHQVTAWARDLLGSLRRRARRHARPQRLGPPLGRGRTGPQAPAARPRVPEAVHRLGRPPRTRSRPRGRTGPRGVHRPGLPDPARPLGGEARATGPHHPSARAGRDRRAAPPPRHHRRLGDVRAHAGRRRRRGAGPGGAHGGAAAGRERSVPGAGLGPARGARGRRGRARGRRPGPAARAPAPDRGGLAGVPGDRRQGRRGERARAWGRARERGDPGASETVLPGRPRHARHPVGRAHRHRGRRPRLGRGRTREARVGGRRDPRLRRPGPVPGPLA